MLRSTLKRKDDGALYTIFALTDADQTFVLTPTEEFGGNIAVPVADLDRDYKVLTVGGPSPLTSEPEGWEALSAQHMAVLTQDPDRKVTPPTPEQQFAVARGEVSAAEIVASPTLRWAFLGGSLACDAKTGERVRRLLEAEAKKAGQ